MTPRQILLAHLEEHHAKQNVGLRRWTSRSTLKELERSHGYAHHHYGDRTHSHHAEGEAPNRGPDSRPRGWRTGEDVVLTGPRKELRWTR